MPTTSPDRQDARPPFARRGAPSLPRARTLATSTAIQCPGRSTTGPQAASGCTASAARAESFGVTAHIDWKPGYAVLVNTPAETAFAREVAVELFGAGQVTLQGPPLTGSEDFAFMLEPVPGSYLLIGNGKGQGVGEGGCMVHNPGYDFNDHNVAVGSAYWVLLAQRFLASKERDATPLHPVPTAERAGRGQGRQWRRRPCALRFPTAHHQPGR